MTQFHERLKQARNEKNLSMKKLGDLVGVTGTSISRYEQGRIPSGEMIRNLAGALGVTAEWLTGTVIEYEYIFTKNGAMRVEKETAKKPDKKKPEEPKEEQPTEPPSEPPAEEPSKNAPKSMIETEVKMPQLNPMAASLDWSEKESRMDHIEGLALKASRECMWLDARVEAMERKPEPAKESKTKTKLEAFMLGVVTGAWLTVMSVIVALLLR